MKWDFEEAGFVPVGWTNNGGTIADGSLNLSNGNNFVYSPEVGAGKYTWEIDVPLVGVGEKWLAGGNIAATNAEERSFSMFVFSGTENDRAACIGSSCSRSDAGTLLYGSYGSLRCTY